MSTSSAAARSAYQLQFRPLSPSSTAHAFPCNALGEVDLDALDANERLNYFFARTLIGHDFDRPTVCWYGKVSASLAARPSSLKDGLPAHEAMGLSTSACSR